MSSCNQSKRDAIFGRDSYERKLSYHHDQGRRRQRATAIIEFFSVTHTSKNFEGARGRHVVVEGGRLCHGTMAQWPVQAWRPVGWCLDDHRNRRPLFTSKTCSQPRLTTDCRSDMFLFLRMFSIKLRRVSFFSHANRRISASCSYLIGAWSGSDTRWNDRIGRFSCDSSVYCIA